MATLLIHVISDFLRDSPPAANQFGETLRCAVMDNELNALTAYGCSPGQIALLQTRDRKKFLQALSDEIGAIMDELDMGMQGVALNYPAGSVRLKEVKVLFSAGKNRTIAIRGDGFAGNLTVSFAPTAGAPVAGAVATRACDKDVWQRLYVTATLNPGDYTVTVVSSVQGQDSTTLTVR